MEDLLHEIGLVYIIKFGTNWETISLCTLCIVHLNLSKTNFPGKATKKLKHQSGQYSFGGNFLKEGRNTVC